MRDAAAFPGPTASRWRSTTSPCRSAAGSSRPSRPPAVTRCWPIARRAACRSSMAQARVRHIPSTSWRGPMGTVSLVLVSHSRQLAEGVRELAAQMTQGKVQIAVAGGTADGRLGTDATAILGAIEEVRGPEGVLILVDLGSAVLSTQMAIEQLGNGQGRVILSNAPFVEGAVIAAVEASIESDLEGVAAAALAAREMEKVSSS